ncbi:hypothetical protein DL765_002850 [Monosporascus sp. GIB2]|nr:hypothetical protein DL765_002850 [Monosporascus sp. GIB2]
MFKFNSYHLFTDIVIACGTIPKGHDEESFCLSTKLLSFKENFDRITDHWHWQGNAAGLADGKANISSFDVRSRHRPRLADLARAQQQAGAAAPLTAVDGRRDDRQPHVEGAYLFWALVWALGMLVLGLWGTETVECV